MSQTVLEKAAEQIAESAHHASHATSVVGDAIGNGVGAVGRAARQGRDVAKEFHGEVTEHIRRHPWLTAATTFAAGLAVGTVIGWMMKRR